jgi:hypothetical protein
VDNKFALALVKNLVFHERNKHIRVKYHFIKSCLDEGSVEANYINTPDQLANFLTKSHLGGSNFRSFVSELGWFKFLQRRNTRLRGRMIG